MSNRLLLIPEKNNIIFCLPRSYTELNPDIKRHQYLIEHRSMRLRFILKVSAHSLVHCRPKQYLFTFTLFRWQQWHSNVSSRRALSRLQHWCKKKFDYPRQELRKSLYIKLWCLYSAPDGTTVISCLQESTKHCSGLKQTAARGFWYYT